MSGARGGYAIRRGIAVLIGTALLFGLASSLSGQGEAPTGQSLGAFIGHKESKKVHRASCTWAQKISEKNRAYFSSYKEASDAGYSPCKICKPDQAEGEAQAAPTPVKGAWVETSPEPEFIADTKTKTVHRHECARAQEVPARRRAYFKAYAEASAAGYSACPLCKPDEARSGEANVSGEKPKAFLSGRPFVGHSETKKVHLAECKHAERIAERNRVYFKTYDEAVNSGYEPCKVCKPDRAERKGAKEAAPAPPASPKAVQNPDTGAKIYFIGSLETKKVHTPYCLHGAKIAASNRIVFETYEEAVRAGFSPCKVCSPDRFVQQAAPAAKAPPPLPAEAPFIGHTGSKKVHMRDCAWAKKIAESNRAYFNTYKEAVAAGYSPCKVCKPDEAEPGQRQSRAPEAPLDAPFIGHIGSKKLHLASCTWAQKMSPRNRVPFSTYSEAVAQGYVPCKICKPDLATGMGVIRVPAQAKESARRPSEGGYVSSEKAKTFHRADCEWAQRIPSDKRIIYATREEAIAAGKKPCQVCKP